MDGELAPRSRCGPTVSVIGRELDKRKSKKGGSAHSNISIHRPLDVPGCLDHAGQNSWSELVITGDVGRIESRATSIWADVVLAATVVRCGEDGDRRRHGGLLAIVRSVRVRSVR